MRVLGAFGMLLFAYGGSVVIRIFPQLKPLYCHRLKEWLDANDPGTVFWNRNSLIWGDNCL